MMVKTGFWIYSIFKENYELQEFRLWIKFNYRINNIKKIVNLKSKIVNVVFFSPL